MQPGQAKIGNFFCFVKYGDSPEPAARIIETKVEALYYAGTSHEQILGSTLENGQKVSHLVSCYEAYFTKNEALNSAKVKVSQEVQRLASIARCLGFII